MPVDTSLYGLIQQPDPWKQAQQGALTADLLTAAQTNRMNLQARQGLSQAYQQATDPTTGQVDRSKLASLVSQDPRTAFQTAEVQQGANAAAQGAQTLDQNTWASHVAKQQYVLDQVSSLAMNPNATTADAHAMLQHLAAAGTVPPDLEKQIEAQIPQDPAQLPGFLNQVKLQAAQGAQRLQMYGQNLGWVNTGGQQVPYQVNPNALGGAGPMPGMQPVTNTTPPQWVQGTDAQGNPAMVPLPAGTPGGYTGRPGAPGLPNGSVTVGNVGAGVGAQAGAQQSSQAYMNAMNVGNASQTNRQTLAGIRNAIQSGANLGPGGAGLTQIQSWLVSHGMSQADADKVQNSEEAYKLMQQYANQMSLGGTGTDSRLNAAIASNPNPAYSKNTNLALVDRLDALERQSQDIRDAFQATGQTPDKFQSWLPTFQKTHGLGVYQFDTLTQQQQQAYLKSMTPAQRQQWATGYADFQQRNQATGAQ
ncbi:hypothetical protein QZN01_20775 [Burkholderia cenocepacia]|uniref:hypothetical protein n=1 Tax=Burkholderia cenocepacia TaxID=95486 RepID=UPI0026542C96|nr:hypothetical protein [Burkholderia cenocepacia]MDN7825090.1 hypothetical protein [Burkholderia cenocepacia]